MSPLPTLPVRRTAANRPSSRPVRMSPSRKVRGLTLLTTLAATIVTTVLAAVSVLLWWAPLIAVAAVGAAFVWLRAGVQSEIAARKAMRRRIVRTRTPRAAASSAPAADRSARDEQATGWTAPEELLETTSVTADAASGAAVDGVATEAPTMRPDGWQPVPVPPPTYTLKAKAERPIPSDDAAAGEAPTASGTGEPTPADGEMQDEQRAAYGT